MRETKAPLNRTVDLRRRRSPDLFYCWKSILGRFRSVVGPGGGEKSFSLLELLLLGRLLLSWAEGGEEEQEGGGPSREFRSLKQGNSTGNSAFSRAAKARPAARGGREGRSPECTVREEPAVRRPSAARAASPKPNARTECNTTRGRVFAGCSVHV